MKTSAIYAGSFDVLTYGHMDIIRQACKFVDNLHVVVADNPSKKYIFTKDERADLLWEVKKNELKDCAENWVPISRYEGLIADYRYFRPYSSEPLLIRGVRNITDLMMEMSLSDTNEEIGGVKTVLIPSSNQFRNVKSSLVKELMSYGKDVSKYVPPCVIEALKRKGLIK